MHPYTKQNKTKGPWEQIVAQLRRTILFGYELSSMTPMKARNQTATVLYSEERNGERLEREKYGGNKREQRTRKMRK